MVKLTALATIVALSFSQAALAGSLAPVAQEPVIVAPAPMFGGISPQVALITAAVLVVAGAAIVSNGGNGSSSSSSSTR